MKRIISLGLCIVLFIVLFVACGEPKQSTTETTTIFTTATTERVSETTVKATNPDTGLPEYVPGSIVLQPNPETAWFDVPYEMKYRFCYYVIPAFVEMLGDELYPDAADYATEHVSNYSEPVGPEEMPLVAYLKRYPIPKEVFEEEANSLIEYNRKIALKVRIGPDGEYTMDPNDEFYEVPNADIIYTFDNDIINEYYRRE